MSNSKPFIIWIMWWALDFLKCVFSYSETADIEISISQNRIKCALFIPLTSCLGFVIHADSAKHMPLVTERLPILLVV